MTEGDQAGGCLHLIIANYADGTGRCTLRQPVLFLATFFVTFFDTHGGKLATLYDDQLPDTGKLIILQYKGSAWVPDIPQRAMFDTFANGGLEAASGRARWRRRGGGLAVTKQSFQDVFVEYDCQSLQSMTKWSFQDIFAEKDCQSPAAESSAEPSLNLPQELGPTRPCLPVSGPPLTRVARKVRRRPGRETRQESSQESEGERPSQTHLWNLNSSTKMDIFTARSGFLEVPRWLTIDHIHICSGKKRRTRVSPNVVFIRIYK